MRKECSKRLLIRILTQIGEDALAGLEESNITHRFPPDNTRSRTICFKGIYLSIYNQETGKYQKHKDNANATSTYEEHEVPAGYTCYVGAATVYFKT